LAPLVSAIRTNPGTILHVDMDAFYASVEVLENPELRGKPVIVGGSAERGVVASCSYEARAYGVRSAMSSVQAKRLCPHAIWVSGDHGRYGEYSAKLHECFHRVTPIVEGIALDEAFLEVSGALRLLGDVETIAINLRADVLTTTGLVCSVGIASRKMLAKLGSEAAKPVPPGKPARPLWPGSVVVSEGVLRVLDGEEVAFLHAHPIEALWGVGPATKAKLDRYGVRSVADLAALPLDVVVRALGNSSGHHLHQLAQAIDERPVQPDRAVKSVGHEETFSSDRRDLAGLAVDATRLADAVSNRMREAKVVGRTITLKIKFADFRMITRARSIAVPTMSGIRIADIARQLLSETDTADQVLSAGVRLLGVSVSSLNDDVAHEIGAESSTEVSAGADVQLDLFGSQDASARDGGGRGGPAHVIDRDDDAFQAAIAAVREKFGDHAVAPASLATERGVRVKRRGDTQWGPSAPPK
jgi:DNA polymerase IV